MRRSVLFIQCAVIFLITIRASAAEHATLSVEAALAEAVHGSASAQYQLGNRYLNGDGVAQNFTDSARWFRLAAENGHTEAQLTLGLMYESGVGVEQDVVRSIDWILMSAQAGLPGAQYKLARMYAYGAGVAADAAAAAGWYARAAAGGVVEAQYELGLAYLNGRGVGRDMEQASSGCLTPPRPNTTMRNICSAPYTWKGSAYRAIIMRRWNGFFTRRARATATPSTTSA
jgi:TPR repeat protein